jgi:hypothetical protein
LTILEDDIDVGLVDTPNKRFHADLFGKFENDGRGIISWHGFLSDIFIRRDKGRFKNNQGTESRPLLNLIIEYMFEEVKHLGLNLPIDSCILSLFARPFSLDPGGGK